MKQNIVGITFNKVSKDSVWDNCKCTLVHDTENQYSNKAISVINENGVKLGHIAERGNHLHELIFNKLPATAKITSFIVVTNIGTFEKKFNLVEGDISSIEIEIDIDADRVDGYYLKDGEKYQSITSFLKDEDTEYLDRWKIDKAGGDYDKYVSELDSVARQGTLMHDLLQHYIKCNTKSEFAKCMQVWNGGYYSDTGEKLYGSDMDTEVVEHILSSIANFKKKFNYSFIGAEDVVYDDELKIAGRYDALLEIDGKKILIDWKSSKSANAKHLFQGSFYAKVMDVDEVWIVRFYLSHIEKAPKQGYSISKLDRAGIDKNYNSISLYKKFKDSLL